MRANLDLSEYPDPAPGSAPYYVLIEEAIGALVVDDGAGLGQGVDRAAALRKIEAAIEGFIALDDRVGEARARAKAAIIFRHLGDGARAAEEARQAMAMLDQEPGAHFYCTAALELGQVCYADGDLDAAMAVYQAALRRLGPPAPDEEPDRRKHQAYFLDLIANIHGELREFDRAIELRRLVIPIFGQFDLVRDLLIAANNLAQDYLKAGRLDQAEDWLTRLQETYDRLSRPVSAHHAWAWACLLRQRLAQAGDAAKRADLVDRARRPFWRAITEFDRAGRPLEANVARLELARTEILYGDHQEAERLLRAVERRIRAGEVDGADDGVMRPRLDTLRVMLFLHQTDNAGLGLDFPAELFDRPGVHASLIVEDEADAFAPGGALLPASSVEELLPFVWARRDPERALAAAEEQKSVDLLRQMHRHHSQGDRALVAALTGLGCDAKDAVAVRPAAHGGFTEAFVDYYLKDDACLLFFERPGKQLEVIELDITPEEIAEAVTHLRRRFDGGGARAGIPGRLVWRLKLDFLQAIGRRVLPIVDELARYDVSVIFPHGPLHNFPFQAIAAADGRPLIATTAVVYGLSRRLLAVARAANRSRAGAPRPPASALVVGVPSSQDANPTGLYGDGEFLRGFGLDVRACEGVEEAAVATVLREMTQPDLIHFNCHGLFSATRPLDSALFLTDGRRLPDQATQFDQTETAKLLTARQVLPLRLRANTVVLRACSSGQTNVRLGDEQEGLARAFVHAGVSSCIVSRWKIDVQSSRDLIRRMYRYWLGAQLPKGIALQRAQRDLLDNPSEEFHRHPYHWAPFTLVGDWW